MSKPKRMTADDWAKVRSVWEQDQQEGFAWLVPLLNLTVSRSAIGKRSAREGWQKQNVTPVTVTQPVPQSVPTVTRGDTGAGRPTDYKPDYDGLAYRLMLLGLTRLQLAEALGVCERTLYNWCDKHPSLLQSIRRGALEADGRVAESLFNRAVGSVLPDQHIALHEGSAVVTPFDKHLPPDPQSMRFWLNNRRPDLWRNKVEFVEPPIITTVDKEALDAVYEKALQEADDRRKALQGRAERLGLVLDGDRGADDDLILDDDILGVAR